MILLLLSATEDEQQDMIGQKRGRDFCDSIDLCVKLYHVMLVWRQNEVS